MRDYQKRLQLKRRDKRREMLNAFLGQALLFILIVACFYLFSGLWQEYLISCNIEPAFIPFWLK